MIKLNLKQINRIKEIIEESFEDSIEALSEAQDDLINDPFGFSDLGFINQDIVDSGQLRDSKKIEKRKQGDDIEVKFSWAPVAPETGEIYAADVFVGFYSFSGKFIPGRDWPNRSAEKIDILGHFKNGIQSRL